jgi:hypothetical protein
MRTPILRNRVRYLLCLIIEAGANIVTGLESSAYLWCIMLTKSSRRGATGCDLWGNLVGGKSVSVPMSFPPQRDPEFNQKSLIARHRRLVLSSESERMLKWRSLRASFVVCRRRYYRLGLTAETSGYRQIPIPMRRGVRLEVKSPRRPRRLRIG